MTKRLHATQALLSKDKLEAWGDSIGLGEYGKWPYGEVRVQVPRKRRPVRMVIVSVTQPGEWHAEDAKSFYARMKFPGDVGAGF